MATVAFYGGFTVAVDPAGGSSYSSVEEVTDIGGLGVTNELIEVTHFGSGGSKEYIAGLADGSEFSITCNKVQTASSTQSDLYTAVDNGTTITCQVTVGGSPQETYSFSMAMLSYELNGDPADAAEVTFTGKVSGAITRA